MRRRLVGRLFLEGRQFHRQLRLLGGEGRNGSRQFLVGGQQLRGFGCLRGRLVHSGDGRLFCGRGYCGRSQRDKGVIHRLLDLRDLRLGRFPRGLSRFERFASRLPLFTNRIGRLA